jgi:hypothetical protein
MAVGMPCHDGWAVRGKAEAWARAALGDEVEDGM